MPNWKKLITSGSSGSLAYLAVDNAITASNLNITSTGSFDRVEANTIDLDRLSLTSTQTTVPPLQLTANSLQDGVGALRIDGSQADIFLNPSTATHTTVTFAVNDDQRLAFGMDNTSDFYITRRTGGSWYDDTFVIDRDTGLLSLGYGISVTGGITGSLLSTNGVLSSSAQIASDISGSITSTSSSIASDIASLVSFSSSLETTIYDYTGSFTGDGSGLTGISAEIISSSTVSDTFTSATTHSVSHTFGTKDVIVNVYDNNDDIFVPTRINTPTTSSVVIYMDPATTGRVVIGKAGHVVSGSADVDLTSVSSNIVPSTNNTYDLGSPTKTWRDLYLSSASLYIDGTQVLSSTSETLTFTTDTGQSIKLLETGADDIIFQTDTGNIELKGTVEVLTGKKITDSAGSAVHFGDSISVTGSINVSGNVDGIDLQAFSASVSTSLANSTADYTQLSNVPSGIVSGSSQITSLTSYTETFTSQTAVTASHSLGTKDVTVSVYGSDDFMIFPTSIKTHDTNNVYVSFNSSRTGRIVITK